jgi:hypothetical protein
MWANESVGGGSVGVVACKGHFVDRDDDQPVRLSYSAESAAIQ